MPLSVPVHSDGSSGSCTRSSTEAQVPVFPAAGGIVQVTQTSWMPATSSPMTRTLNVSVPALNEVSTPVIVGGAARAGVTAVGLCTGPPGAGSCRGSTT